MLNIRFRLFEDMQCVIFLHVRAFSFSFLLTKEDHIFRCAVFYVLLEGEITRHLSLISSDLSEEDNTVDDFEMLLSIFFMVSLGKFNKKYQIHYLKCRK